MSHRITTWILKGLGGLGLAALLSACNMVVTTEPTFLAADQGAPALREGLWVSEEKGCDFDINQPAGAWPACARWMVIKDFALTGVTEEGERFRIPFVLSSGDPRVMQLRLEDEEKKTVDGQVASLYLYMGLRPLATDPQGRITAYAGWIVQCGPPPPMDAKRPDGAPRYGALAPSPGMIMDKESSGCAPRDKASLIRAAGLSEHYDAAAKSGEAIRWVRDGGE